MEELDEEELDVETLEEELDTPLLLSSEQPVNNAKQNPAIATAYFVAKYFLFVKYMFDIPLSHLEGIG